MRATKVKKHDKAIIRHYRGFTITRRQRYYEDDDKYLTTHEGLPGKYGCDATLKEAKERIDSILGFNPDLEAERSKKD